MTGTVTIDVVDGSRPVRLGFRDDGREADADVTGATAAVAAVLDEFLTGVQARQGDLLVIGGKWLRDENPELAELLETTIAPRANPVTAAAYDMVVQVEPDPTLVSVELTVTRLNGSTRAVGLVFDVTGDRPLLQVAGMKDDA